MLGSLGSSGGKPLGVAVLLLVVAAGASAFFLTDGGEPDQRLDLRWRAGDVLTYEGQRGDTEITLSLGATAEVRHQDGSLVEAVPVSVDVSSLGPSLSEVYLIRTASGGLVFLTDSCLVEQAPCPEIVRVSWQLCPLNFFLVPATAHAGEELTERVELEDPFTGDAWIYGVSRDGERVSLELERETGAGSPYCNPGERVVVDAQRGVVEAFEVRGTTFELTRYVEGDGERIRFGTEAMEAYRMGSPDVRRDGPFPAGAGSIGPDEWPLQAAWETARDESEAVASFAEEDAIVYDHQIRESTGVEARYTWDLQLLRPDGKGLEVRSERACVQGVCDESVETSSWRPPEDVPVPFEPPSRRQVSLDAFVAAVEERGWTMEESRQPAFDVVLGANRSGFLHLLFRDFEGRETGTTSAAIALSADTGRLESAHLHREEAQRLFP